MEIELTKEELEMLEDRAKRDASNTLVEESFGLSTDYADIKEYCDEILSKNENLTSSDISIEIENDDWGGSRIIVSYFKKDDWEKIFDVHKQNMIRAKEHKYFQYLRLKEEFEK